MLACRILSWLLLVPALAGDGYDTGAVASQHAEFAGKDPVALEVQRAEDPQGWTTEFGSLGERFAPRQVHKQLDATPGLWLHNY